LQLMLSCAVRSRETKCAVLCSGATQAG
jgi:hypothetical protein